MENSRSVPSLALWEEFAASLDDAVFDGNSASGKALWTIPEIGLDHLRVESLEDSMLAVDIDFFPGVLRVVALFSPSGTMHVYDFGSGRELESELGPHARPANPRSLGKHLLGLISNPDA
jgi:hypothetical protein